MGRTDVRPTLFDKPALNASLQTLGVECLSVARSDPFMWYRVTSVVNCLFSRRGAEAQRITEDIIAYNAVERGECGLLRLAEREFIGAEELDR